MSKQKTEFFKNFCIRVICKIGFLNIDAQYLAQHRREVLAQHRRDCSNKSGLRKSSLLKCSNLYNLQT